MSFEYFNFYWICFALSDYNKCFGHRCSRRTRGCYAKLQVMSEAQAQSSSERGLRNMYFEVSGGVNLRMRIEVSWLTSRYTNSSPAPSSEDEFLTETHRNSRCQQQQQQQQHAAALASALQLLGSRSSQNSSLWGDGTQDKDWRWQTHIIYIDNRLNLFSELV